MPVWLVILLSYSFGLWWYCVPFTGDEKVYVSTAMEMWTQKSWLYPYLFGEHSYFKPPWSYWMTLAGWKFFGFGNFGTYFPSVLALVLTAIGLDRTARLFTQESREPSSAGIWFAAAAGTLTFGSTAQMEIWLVFFWVWSGWAFLKFALPGPRPRTGMLYLALALAGLLSLVKSPLYSVLAVSGFWLFLLLQRRFRAFLSLHFLLSHLAGIAIGASWFLFILATDHDRFWNHYVLGETLAKLGGNGSSIFQMWADFSTFLFPFSFLVLVLIFSARPKKDLSLFLVSTLSIPAVFFSWFPYRTETYLYILLPGIVLWLDLQHRKDSVPQRWIARLNAALVGGAILALASVLILTGAIPIFLTLLLLLSLAALARASWQYRWRSMAWASLALITFLRLGAVSIGEQDVEGLRKLATEFPTRSFTFLDEGRNHWHETGILSVAIGRPGNRALSIDQALKALRDRSILVLSEGQWERLKPLLFVQEESVEHRPWLRWKRGFDVPTVRDLRDFGDRSSPRWEAKNRRRFDLVWLK